MIVRILGESDDQLYYFVLFRNTHPEKYNYITLVFGKMWGKRKTEKFPFHTLDPSIKKIFKLKERQIKKLIKTQTFWKAKQRGWEGIFYKVSGYDNKEV